MFVHDGETISFANRAAAEMYGFDDPSELVGTAVMDRIHPDGWEFWEQRAETILTERKPLPVVEQVSQQIKGLRLDRLRLALDPQFPRGEVQLTTGKADYWLVGHKKVRNSSMGRQESRSL